MDIRNIKKTNNLQICTYMNAIKENYKPHTEPLYQPTFTVTALKIRDVATSRPSVGLHVVFDRNTSST